MSIEKGCPICSGAGSFPTRGSDAREPCGECERVRGLVEAEREACARLCEQYEADWDNQEILASAIRKGGEQ